MKVLPEFVEAEPGVPSAYLCGSHAKHRAHRESGVDVGVLDRARHPSSAGRSMSACGCPPCWSMRWLAHPDVVVLNDVPPGVAASIVTTRRRVYVADEAADHSFRALNALAVRQALHWQVGYIGTPGRIRAQVLLSDIDLWPSGGLTSSLTAPLHSPRY